jgi:hypothetical protein
VAAIKREGGQASVELVAIVPALLVATLVGIQLALVGYGMWSSANAARAGARAAYVGGDERAAALSAVPGPLRRGADVSGRNAVQVSLRVPSLLPGAGPIPVSARAALGPEDADG